MTYRVNFMPEAVRDLNRLDKLIARRIQTRIRWLSENFGSITPEVLTGDWQRLFKLRVGSYRIIYTVDKKEQLIIVHLVSHRKDIYRMK